MCEYVIDRFDAAATEAIVRRAICTHDASQCEIPSQNHE